MKNFAEHFLPGVVTPILLPQEYNLVRGVGDVLVYTSTEGETVEHYAYMDHAGSAVIVDEFRKLFPHDSILVMLYDAQRNIFLQKRSSAMRWEPNKLDLASVAAQRRAVLSGDHYEAVPLDELALAKVAEETAVPHARIYAEQLHQLGTHENSTTNEFQTVYAYHLEASAAELNALLASVDDVYKAQSWEKRPYEEVMQQYFGEGVDEYAGGATLRPHNFISNASIREQLDKVLA